MASFQTPPRSDVKCHYKVKSYTVPQTHPDLPRQTPNTTTTTTTTVVTIIFKSSIKIVLKWSCLDTISNRITNSSLSENRISKCNINLFFTDESSAKQTIDAALSSSSEEVINCLPCPLKNELTHSIFSCIQSSIQDLNCADLAEVVFAFDVVVMEHILRCYHINDGADLSESGSLIIMEKKNEDCVICFDEIVAETGDKCYFPCNHCFHADCICIWLLEKDTCPICRYTLREAHD